MGCRHQCGERMDRDGVRRRYLVAAGKRVGCLDSRAGGGNAVGVGANGLPHS